MLDEETKKSPLAYPSKEVLDKTEVFLNLPENVMKMYDDAWTEIKTNQLFLENINLIVKI